MSHAAGSEKSIAITRSYVSQQLRIRETHLKRQERIDADRERQAEVVREEPRPRRKGGRSGAPRFKNSYGGSHS